MLDKLMAYVCVECALSATIFYCALKFPMTSSIIRQSDEMTALAVFGVGMAAKPAMAIVTNLLGSF